MIHDDVLRMARGVGPGWGSKLWANRDGVRQRCFWRPSPTTYMEDILLINLRMLDQEQQGTQSLVEWSLGWSESKRQTRTMSWTCIMIHFDNSTSMIPWLSLSNSPNSSVLSAVRGPGLPLFVSGPLLKPCLRCQESTRTSQTSLKLAKDLTNLFLEFSSLFAETK